MTCCDSYFDKIKIVNDGVELLLTLHELNDLIGFVASEANHAISKKMEQELSDVFEYLEGVLYSLR